MNFEDLRVGKRTVSPARTITEADVVLFATLTGDRQAVHTDAQYARHTVYGERIAHGLLTLAISGGLMCEEVGIHTAPQSTITLYGLEKARFTAPTKIGDTIHVEAEVVQVKPIDEHRDLITCKHHVINQRGEEVLSYTNTLIVNRRPATLGDDHG